MLAGLDNVAELVYIPVFDHTIPNTEVHAVLEVILSKHAVDPMAVANAITFISGFLGTLQVCPSGDPPPCAKRAVAAAIHSELTLASRWLALYPGKST